MTDAPLTLGPAHAIALQRKVNAARLALAGGRLTRAEMRDACDLLDIDEEQFAIGGFWRDRFTLVVSATL